MKNIKLCLVLCAFLLFASVVVLCGCSSTVSQSTEVHYDQEKGSSQALGEWEWDILPFSQVVLDSNTAFIGTLTEYEWVDGISKLNMTMLKATFHVDEDIYGNLLSDEAVCFVTNGFEGVSKPKTSYQIGNQYLMITTAEKRLFHPIVEFFPVDNVFFDVTNHNYVRFGEKMPFDSKESICSEIADIWRESGRTPAGVYVENNGTWDSAEYLAEVRLVRVNNPASQIFTGTNYFAEVVRVFRGKEEDIWKPSNGWISLTLCDADTEVGKSYIVGFSGKNGADTVYSQEGLETISTPESFDMSVVTPR